MSYTCRGVCSYLIATVLFTSCAPRPKTAPPPPKIACDPDNAGITVPAGFCALVFAQGLPHARYIDVAENGDVYVSIENTAERDTVKRPAVYALRDTTRDGRADIIQPFGRRGNTGLALYNDWLYVDQGETINRYFRPAGQLIPTSQGETIVSGLPQLPGHRARNFAIAPDGTMYVNVGAPSNSCQVKDRAKESPGKNPCEELDTRAGIWRFDANRVNQTFSTFARYATGARNSTGIAFAPIEMNALLRNGRGGRRGVPEQGPPQGGQQGRERGKRMPMTIMRAGPLYAMTHGRDQLTENWPKIFPDTIYGTNNPAEELIEVNAGDDFGWPYCYYSVEVGHLVDAPEYGGDGHRTVLCVGKKQPAAVYPAHWAPLDLMFYTGMSFPQEYRGGAFISFHGSWNRMKGMQAGGKIVYQPFKNGKPSGDYKIFADGFAGVPPTEINPQMAKHRPVGMAIGPDGSLYVADDKGGRIYRIIYNGPPTP